MFFHELFEGKKADKIDRIVSFLAVLELLRNNRIDATQKKPFDVILIEEKGGKVMETDDFELTYQELSPACEAILFASGDPVPEDRIPRS